MSYADPYASRYAHLGEDLRWMHDVPDGMPVLLEVPSVRTAGRVQLLDNRAGHLDTPYQWYLRCTAHAVACSFMTREEAGTTIAPASDEWCPVCRGDQDPEPQP